MDKNIKVNYIIENKKQKRRIKMDRNVKIAKELIKLAKSLVADDKVKLWGFIRSAVLNEPEVRKLFEKYNNSEVVIKHSNAGGGDSDIDIEVPESKVEEVKKEFENAGIKLQE